MKLLFLLPLLLSVLCVDAFSLWKGDSNQAVTHDSRVDIPGASPLRHCTPDHADDQLLIRRVDLTPNPPAAYAHAPLRRVCGFPD